jgi:ER-bound oxygenase mpaB/B'/Rubber oxygenase, catalytic domain
MTATADAPQTAGASTPTDFRYWEALERPGVQRARAIARRLLRFDPCPPDDVARMLCEDLRAGDPVAERFVDEVFFGPAGPRAGRKLLDRALADGIDAVSDAPDAMRELFAEFEQVPDWVDRELVEEGARIWRRWGTSLFAFAGAETLEMYTESAVVVPLSLTGGYAGDNALRRFLETTRFWMDVSEPGALFRIGSEGRATAMRVRVMHVSVRRRVSTHAEWDVARYGLPISQAYMYLTLMGGSVAPAVAMWPLGFLTTGKEIRALMHYQRYLGHLLGVHPRGYPETVREGFATVTATALARSYTAGRQGAELIESFAPAFRPRSRRGTLRWFKELYEYRLICGYVAFFLQPGTRKRHDVPSAWWMLVPFSRVPLVVTRELARHFVPGAAARQEAAAVAEREQWYAIQMDGRQAEFDAGSALRR